MPFKSKASASLMFNALIATLVLVGTSGYSNSPITSWRSYDHLSLKHANEHNNQRPPIKHSKTNANTEIISKQSKDAANQRFKKFQEKPSVILSTRVPYNPSTLYLRNLDKKNLRIYYLKLLVTEESQKLLERMWNLEERIDASMVELNSIFGKKHKNALDNASLYAQSQIWAFDERAQLTLKEIQTEANILHEKATKEILSLKFEIESLVGGSERANFFDEVRLLQTLPEFGKSRQMKGNKVLKFGQPFPSLNKRQAVSPRLARKDDFITVASSATPRFAPTSNIVAEAEEFLAGVSMTPEGNGPSLIEKTATRLADSIGQQQRTLQEFVKQYAPQPLDSQSLKEVPSWSAPIVQTFHKADDLLSACAVAVKENFAGTALPLDKVSTTVWKVDDFVQKQLSGTAEASTADKSTVDAFGQWGDAIRKQVLAPTSDTMRNALWSLDLAHQKIANQFQKVQEAQSERSAAAVSSVMLAGADETATVFPEKMLQTSKAVPSLAVSVVDSVRGAANDKKVEAIQEKIKMHSPSPNQVQEEVEVAISTAATHRGLAGWFLSLFQFLKRTFLDQRQQVRQVFFGFAISLFFLLPKLPAFKGQDPDLRPPMFVDTTTSRTLVSRAAPMSLTNPTSTSTQGSTTKLFQSQQQITTSKKDAAVKQEHNLRTLRSMSLLRSLFTLLMEGRQFSE